MAHFIRQVNSGAAEVLYAIVRDLALRGRAALLPPAVAAPHPESFAGKARAAAQAAAQAAAATAATAAGAAGPDTAATEAAATEAAATEAAATTEATDGAAADAAPAPAAPEAAASAPAEMETEAAEGAEEAPQPTVVLDVCCGTGTIGLCMQQPAAPSAAGAGEAAPAPALPEVSHVVGVDICAPAIVDARANAARNGVDAGRAIFVCAPAEKVMRAVLKGGGGNGRHSHGAAGDPTAGDAANAAAMGAACAVVRGAAVAGAPLVAVVDPARAGLHPKARRFVKVVESHDLFLLPCTRTYARARARALARAGPLQVNGRLGIKLVRQQPPPKFIWAARNVQPRPPWRGWFKPWFVGASALPPAPFSGTRVGLPMRQKHQHTNTCKPMHTAPPICLEHTF